MLQHKLKLTTEFAIALKDCDEIWIAVALINEFGFDTIQRHTNVNAIQNYLIGIGLPSSPVVFGQLLELESVKCKSKIYHDNGKFFHPKLYMFRTGDKLVAYVGSANCTEGGLETNLELSIKIEDQELCRKLEKLFNSLFKFGKPITVDFLQAYSDLYERRLDRDRQDRKDVKLVFPVDNNVVSLADMDFSNQFFKAHHFKAFEGTKPLNHSEEVNQERMEVRNYLYKLHSKLKPFIEVKRWDLHEHYESEHIVSSAIHSYYTSDELTGIWLHYGRNKREIKKYGDGETPLEYMRIQVIVRKDRVGIWNRVGKDNGNRIDRENLINKLRDQKYGEKFYSMMMLLPSSFFIMLNGERRNISGFLSEKELTDFVLTDNKKHYFIIGTEFSPDAEEISETNIVSAVIENFGHLYPTYEFIKHELGF